ncbi:MAG: hypothetical protein AAGU23_11215 [Bacillota bacterium]
MKRAVWAGKWGLYLREQEKAVFWGKTDEPAGFSSRETGTALTRKSC